MKNNIKHPHFRRKLEYYIQGLIAGKFTLKQVSVYTGYTIQHLSYLKIRYDKEGSKTLINGYKGLLKDKRYIYQENLTLTLTNYTV